jgi:hypothetical protein
VSEPIRRCQVRSRCASDATSSAPRLPAAAHPAAQLQRVLGNQGAQRVLRAGAIQPELRMGQPSDPRSTAGRHLLAHELAHVVQQSGPAAATAPMIQRQPAGQREPQEPSLPLFQIPGTGLTVIPGVFRLTSLAGMQLPLPASLRLTNALGVGAGPRWVLDLSPHALVGTVLDKVDLSVSATPGTPPEREPSPENTARISLVRPMVRFDPRTGQLRGWATLQVPTGYPLTISTPTEIDVEIESSAFGQFSGTLGYGPLHADFQLRRHYDTARFESALRPILAPQGGFAGLWARFRQVLLDTVPGIPLTGVSDGLQSALRALTSGQMRDQHIEATRGTPTPAPALPNFGLTLYGSF